MSYLRYAGVILLWIASLVVAAQWGVRAQSGTPMVLSGSDVGFKVDGQGPTGRPYGSFVVRINGGDWVPVDTSPRMNPATVK